MRSQVDPVVAEANRKVDEEAERFRAALPALLDDPGLRGRYVVFKDGAIMRGFDDAGEGYRWAVATLGRYAGFVLARVEPERVYRIGGAGFRIDPDSA